MPAIVQSSEQKRNIRKVDAALSYSDGTMSISYEDSSNENDSDVAYNDEETSSQNQQTLTSTNQFIDNIIVLENERRPTINIKYRFDLDESEDFYSPIEENEEIITNEPTFEFVAEEIVEIADSAFSTTVANRAIESILGGYIPDRISTAEILTPWQSNNGKFIGESFLNEFDFYQYAEVETPDTEEFLSGVVQGPVAEDMLNIQNEIDQDKQVALLEFSDQEILSFETSMIGIDNDKVDVESISIISINSSIFNLSSYV